VDNGHTISVIPVSKNPVKALRGKFKGVDLVGDLLKERQKDRERE
jgi:hypothetical protein